MKRQTPLSIIRDKCLDCGGDQPKEVRLCQVFTCPLWTWRFGSRPTTLRKRKPWLLDQEIVEILGEAEGQRELYHESRKEPYLRSFRELTAKAAAKYPQIRNERYARLGAALVEEEVS